MYWIIPLLLAFLCTLVNPYLGLVGLLYIGEIAVYLFFDGNAEKAADFASGYVEKTDAKYYEILKKAGKGCLNFWCGLAVLFFVLMTIISVIVETVASGTMLGGPTTLTPFLIGSKENRAAYGVALLMVSILLHIVALVLKEENPVNRLENIRIGIGGIPVVLILAAGVFGMMNEYFGWLSFLLHAAYLIGIGVMTVVIGGIFRFAQKNETMKKGVQYFVNYVTDGTPYYHFIIGGMWIVTAFLVILQLLLGLGYKNDIFMMFGLHRGTSAMVISCLLELAAAVWVSMKMYKKNQ